MASTNFDYVQSCNAKGGEKCNHFHRDIVNASICAARAHTTHLVNFDANDKMLGKPYARMATMDALLARKKRLGAASTDSRWDKKAPAKKTAAKKAAPKKAAGAKKKAAKAPAKKAASAKPAVVTKADEKKKAA